MEMIVIYDDTGKIYFCGGGEVQEPSGLPFLRIVIPNGKNLVSIDLSGETPKPIFSDIPKDPIANEIESIQAKLDFLAIMTGTDVVMLSMM